MMENIQVLLLLAILFFSLFRFINKEKNTSTSPPLLPEEDEEFLNVEMAENLASTYQPLTSKLNETHKKATFFDKRAKAIEKDHPSVSAPMQPQSSETIPSIPIKINNRLEAKKAFIYSEIFNRKY
ncbi:MAG: hypothetical protein ACRC3Z_03955 [Phocaeicola sp.]